MGVEEAEEGVDDKKTEEYLRNVKSPTTLAITVGHERGYIEVKSKSNKAGLTRVVLFYIGRLYVSILRRSKWGKKNRAEDDGGG